MLIEMKLNDPTIVIVTIGQALCRCCYDFISNSIQIHVASKNSIIQTYCIPFKKCFNACRGLVL